MVAAFLKLGMPTMMSARPSRAICSWMAGVRAAWGTRPPYHRRPRVSPVPGAAGDSAAGNRDAHPLVVGGPRLVAAVGGPEAQIREPERSPRTDPGIDRRAHEDPATDQVRFDDDGIQDPTALEEGDVEEGLAVEPEQIDGHERDD